MYEYAVGAFHHTISNSYTIMRQAYNEHFQNFMNFLFVCTTTKGKMFNGTQEILIDSVAPSPLYVHCTCIKIKGRKHMLSFTAHALISSITPYIEYI